MARRPDSSVIITSIKDDENGFGTGFIIATKQKITYIATCAHVINNLGGIDYVKVAGQKAEVVNGLLPGLDLAILSTTPPLEKPAISLQTEVFLECEVRIEGFSRLVDMTVFDTLDGKLTREREIECDNQRIRMWELNTEDGLDGGYSGSPVVHKETNCAIAVIVHSRGSKAGNAVSVEGLNLLWKGVSELFIRDISFVLPDEDRLVKDISFFILKSKDNRIAQIDKINDFHQERRSVEKNILDINKRIEYLHKSEPFNAIKTTIDDDVFRQQIRQDRDISFQAQKEINELKQKREELVKELRTIEEDITEANALRDYYEERSAFEEKVLSNNTGRKRRLKSKIKELWLRIEKTTTDSFIFSVIESDIGRYRDYIERLDTPSNS